MARRRDRSRLSRPLATERLSLRPFVDGDFDALYSYQSRPDVVRWLYWEARSKDEVREALQKKLRSTGLRAEGDVLSLAVILNQTGELIGDFILHLLSQEHRTAEIGFIVHPDHQGRGYAT